MSQASEIERVNARFENSQPIGVGRIVHVPLKPHPYGYQEVVPALVVRVGGNNCLNLQVFYDGTNSHEHREDGSDDPKHDAVPHMIAWKRSVTYDGGEQREIDDPANLGEKKFVTIYNPHTWHWPPRA